MSKLPHVFLLGWAGSQPKHLAKYLPIWTKLGLKPHAHSLPFMTFKHAAMADNVVHDYYQNVFKPAVQKDNNGILMHVFSNNGAGSLAAMWEIMGREDRALKERVKGVVFDSGPADTLVVSAALSAGFATLWPQQAHNRLARLAFYCGVGPAFLGRALWCRGRALLQPAYLAAACPFHRLLALPDLPPHQLFLYSTRDVACPFGFIERFARRQTELGKTVRTVRWTDTDHVAHLRKHEDEYTRLCHEFVAQAFSGQ